VKSLLCQIGRNNARQYDAIEGACTSNTNDANFVGFDILEMHEIGADGSKPVYRERVRDDVPVVYDRLDWDVD